MNKDIISVEDGKDLGIAISDVPKAANVLSVQLGELEYAQEFGVDFKYFLTPNLQFQNESFKAYLVERLTRSQINVASVITVIESLLTRFSIRVGDESSGAKGLIR